METGYKKSEALTLNNLGTLNLKKNNLQRAEQYFKRALEIVRWTGAVNNKLLLFNNLAFLMAVKEKKEDAIDLLNEALITAENIHNKMWEMRILNMFFFVHFYVFEDLELAQSYIERSKSLFSEVEDRGVKLMTLLLDAELSAEMAERFNNNIILEKAITILKDMVPPELKKTVLDAPDVLKAHSILAKCYALKEWYK